MLGKHHLPVVIAQSSQVAIIREIEKLLARAFRLLTGQVRQLVVTVKVDFVGFAIRRITFEQLFLDVRHTGDGQQRRRPIQMGYDVIGNAVWLDVPRPAHHRRNTVSAFPIRVLLAAERGHAGIGPRVHVRAVVGAIHDDGIVS